MYEIEMKSARDWMEPPELELGPDDDVLAAVERLADLGAPGAPVVDENRCLLGLLTEKDSLRYLSISAFELPRAGTVGDYMSPVSVSVDPEMDLFRVAELFLGNNFPVLAVVENGTLCGQITRQQVLRGIQAMRRELEQEIARHAGQAVGPETPRSIEHLQNVFSRFSRKQLVSLLGRSHD